MTSPTPWSKFPPRPPSFSELRELCLLVNNGDTENIRRDAEYCADAYISVFDSYVPDQLDSYKGKLMHVIWPNQAANSETFGWVNGKLEILTTKS